MFTIFLKFSIFFKQFSWIGCLKFFDGVVYWVSMAVRQLYLPSNWEIWVQIPVGTNIFQFFFNLKWIWNVVGFKFERTFRVEQWLCHFYLAFEETSKPLKWIIIICGKHLWNANFKMGSAISVRKPRSKLCKWHKKIEK